MVLPEDFGFRKKTFSLAPLSDRVSAFFLDVLLLTPFYGVFFASLIRKIEFRYFISPQSTEFWILSLAGLLSVFASTLILQAVSLYLWQTTPGKYFFKLQVQSLTSKELSFSQCLLRSGLWCFEFFMFGVPFLEILGHPQRRPLHDRASDTVVVTLKQEKESGPTTLETRFVRQVIFAIVGVVFLWSVISMVKLYRMAEYGAFKLSELQQEQYLCSEINVSPGESRIDQALAMHLIQGISQECLEAETDFAFWTNQVDQHSWAHLAKAFIYNYDQKLSDEYLSRVCQTAPSGEACRIAHHMVDEKWELPPHSLTSQILSVKSAEQIQNFSKVLELIKSLPHHPGFRDYIQRETVKNIWRLGRYDQAWGGYESIYSFLNDSSQEDLSSWLCVEQLHQSCTHQTYKSCEQLMQQMRANNYQEVSDFGVYAAIQYRECKGSSEPSLLYFHEQLTRNQNLKNLISAIIGESNWSSERRENVLNQLITSKDELSGQASWALKKMRKERLPAQERQ